MIMKKEKVILIILILLMFCLASYFVILLTIEKKVAWINLPDVYKNFEFKKELENKLIKTTEARKMIIDSLELELRIISDEIQTGKKDNNKIELFKQKRANYLTRKKVFDEDNYMNKEKYEEQIMTQLSQYVKDYGKEHNYQFIYGADGSGTVMYADEGMNITEEVKKYVNEKYKGLK